ncbi:MAG: glycine cleavage system protein H [Pseudomonadota bacterium]|nr:glycine cleavage system protein H [Gammaproteobacteria bacterium]MBU1731363.1 glycine cleavage system protein H [Gammaproteobacteria bacterium]MBU1892868.1 glycine cleavage system protein H [Gammaproteobacteria bacterium]
MATVRGCDFPDDLYYNVENNVWARLEQNGSITVGMTIYGCALAGEIVSCMPKKPGKVIEQNKSVATIESGKWVGPVKAPVGGEIIAVNEELDADPGLMNRDPYVQGWVVRMTPAQWQNECGELISGPATAEAFEAKMAAEGFAGCGD